MVCCTLIAGLLALLMQPLRALRGNPLAWRPAATVPQSSLAPLFAGRVRSFTYALAGIRFALRNEPNMRIHLGAGTLAVAAGLWLRITADDWRWLIIAIAMVLATEALNTGVEQCCNAVSRDYSPAIKAAKDVAAGAVLISAIAALLIGLSVLGPHLFAVGGSLPPGFPTLFCGGKV
jgi:diacylglycerol kinase